MQVDCTAEVELCREHQITGFPSIRVFRAGKSMGICKCLSASNAAASLSFLVIDQALLTYLAITLIACS